MGNGRFARDHSPVRHPFPHKALVSRRHGDRNSVLGSGGDEVSSSAQPRARESRTLFGVRSGQSLNQVWSHMKVTPLHDRLIVQRLDEGEQTVGSIIVPDSAKEKPQRGKVFAVGLGKVKEDGSRQKPDVKDGDTILFGKYSGQEIKLDGQEYLIMREDDVLAIIDSK